MYDKCHAFFENESDMSLDAIQTHIDNGSTTPEHLIEKFHQEFMFKVEFDFEEGGDFFEDIMLDEQDYED